MSQVTIQGNPSGTGTFTIQSPNSNTNRTQALPDESGTILTDAKLATEVEAQAGTDNTKLMTPLRVAQAIDVLATVIDYQVFTASGTWTKPTGLSANAVVYVEIIGGGGSGGARVRGSGGSSGNAAGGGGGGFVAKTVAASSLGATVAVTVGAGGTAVSWNSASGNAWANGNAGGTSSFGSFSSLGGGGGAGNNSVTVVSAVHGFDGYIGGDNASDGSLVVNSIHGGGAGGAAEGGATARSPGTSRFAGNGGAAAVGGSGVTASAGSAPGGGGGGACSSSTVNGIIATSGAGARGEVRVWTIG